MILLGASNAMTSHLYSQYKSSRLQRGVSACTRWQACCSFGHRSFYWGRPTAVIHGRYAMMVIVALALPFSTGCATRSLFEANSIYETSPLEYTGAAISEDELIMTYKVRIYRGGKETSPLQARSVSLSLTEILQPVDGYEQIEYNVKGVNGSSQQKGSMPEDTNSPTTRFVWVSLRTYKVKKITDFEGVLAAGHTRVPIRNLQGNLQGSMTLSKIYWHIAGSKVDGKITAFVRSGRGTDRTFLYVKDLDDVEDPRIIGFWEPSRRYRKNIPIILICLPITLALDLVTFPLQIIGSSFGGMYHLSH